PMRIRASAYGKIAGFVLQVITAAPDHKVWLNPNQLGSDLKPGGFETAPDNGSLNAGVPDVSERSRIKYVGLLPIRTVVIQDRSYGPIRFTECAIPPVRIVFNAVWRVCNHDIRNVAFQELFHIDGVGGVTAT